MVVAQTVNTSDSALEFAHLIRAVLGFDLLWAMRQPVEIICGLVVVSLFSGQMGTSGKVACCHARFLPK